eukprot:scaffold21180_cov31-Tisochrysis_lutea.AAC.4
MGAESATALVAAMRGAGCRGAGFALAPVPSPRVTPRTFKSRLSISLGNPRRWSISSTCRNASARNAAGLLCNPRISSSSSSFRARSAGEKEPANERSNLQRPQQESMRVEVWAQFAQSPKLRASREALGWLFGNVQVLGSIGRLETNVIEEHLKLT